MLLENFKNLVDNTPQTLYTNELEEAYKTLKLDYKTSLTLSESDITKHIYSTISSSISLKEKEEKENIKRLEFINLRNDLIYRYILFDENPIEYLKIISVINDSCRKDCNYFVNFNNTENWKTAIENCKNYIFFRPNTFTIELKNLRKDYPKQYDIATSAKYLIKNDCKIEIINSQINIIEGFDAIAIKLEEMIKNLGGITLIKSIFNYLSQKKQYSERFERYLMPRKTSGLGYEQKPEIPFGYLLNIALKYPYEKLKLKNPQKELNNIIELSIIMTNGAFGVQQYNMWENIFQDGETIIKLCTDIALWDSLYNFPQTRPTSAFEITQNLFSYIDNSIFENTLGFKKEDFWCVVNKINSINANPNNITIIYVSKLEKELKQIDTNIIQSILNFLSHKSDVNKDYNLPSDYFHIDFFLKPLLKLSPTKFVLLNKSWCSPSYFESLATHFREVLKIERRDLDYELGQQLEIYLQEKLKRNNINFFTGNYRVNGVDGECDLLIETDKSIILIEFKKKTLTRKAKSGIDINVLLDLVESLFNAQIQAGRTEIFLREEKELILVNNKKEEFKIELKDRTIERIALTQLEFGGFQDRTIVKSFLKSFLTHSFNTNSNDKQIIKKFEKLAEKQKVWIDQYEKLINLDKSFEHHPYFNCWFLSLPQLMEIINLSNDNNSFYETLTNTKYITMSTLDWYFEFNYTNSLKNHQDNVIKK